MKKVVEWVKQLVIDFIRYYLIPESSTVIINVIDIYREITRGRPRTAGSGVQVPFTLQPVSFSQINEYLGSICDYHGLPIEQVSDITNTISPHLEALIAGTSINPREIKRYINVYTIQMKIKGVLDPNIVLTLLTINFRQEWDIVKQALITFRQTFTDAIIEHQDGNPDNLSNLVKNLGKIPQDFLDYVEHGKSGFAILKQGINLDEYLYSGESTRSESGLSYLQLDIIKGLVESLQILETINETRSIAESSVSELNGMVRFLYSSKSETIRSVERDLRHIENELLTLPVEPDKIVKWAEGIEEIVRRLLRRLSAAR